MGATHVSLGAETEWGEWADPTLTIPVESCNINPAIPLMKNEDTGAGRGARRAAHGELTLAGAINMKLYPISVWRILSTVFGVRNKVATAISTPANAQTTHTYVAGDYIKPTSGNAGAYFYKCTVGGQSAGSAPTWSQVAGASVTDGAVTWVNQGVWSTPPAGYRNIWLPDDDLDFGSMSIQKRYGPTVIESFRGCKVNSFTLSARSKEYAKLVANIIGKDVAPYGGEWVDGSAAPEVFAPAYPIPMPDAFKFYQGTLRLGGTVAKNGNDELVVTGGTDRVEVDNISLEVALGLSNNAFGVVLDDYTVQSIDEGARVVTVKFEPNFKTVGLEFYNAWRNGEPAIAELYFRGPEYDTILHKNYEAKIVVPYVQYSAAANPQLDAAFGLKRTQVTGEGKLNEDVATDIGVVVQSTEDLSTWAVAS